MVSFFRLDGITYGGVTYRCCALLREKELMIELMVQTRWRNRAAVHLFLFIVSAIVHSVSSGGLSHHSECRHSLPDSAEGATTARREVSFPNGFTQVAEVQLPPRTHDNRGRILTHSAPDGAESHQSERNRLPSIRVDPSLTRNRKDAP